MNITIWTFAIVCPLVFLAGFVDSIAGGGGVISLPAYLIAGVPIKLAAGTNKFANGCGTALASYKYMKSGNIDWWCALHARCSNGSRPSRRTHQTRRVAEWRLRLLL